MTGTAHTRQTAMAEVVRLSTELAAVTDAGTDPIEVGRLRIALELAEGRLAQVVAADARKQDVAREAKKAVVLDGVKPAMVKEDENLWRAIEPLETVVGDIIAASRNHDATRALLIGQLSTYCDATESPRYTVAGGQHRVEGRPLTSACPGVATEVCRIVAPLLALGNPQLAEQVRSAGSLGPRLRHPAK